MNRINKLFLFIMTGMLFQAAPNLLCAAATAPVQAVGNSAVDPLAGIIKTIESIKAGEASFDLPQEYKDCSSEEKQKLKAIFVLEALTRGLQNGLNLGSIKPTTDNIESILAKISQAKVEATVLSGELAKKMREKGNDALGKSDRLKIELKEKLSLLNKRWLELQQKFMFIKKHLDARAQFQNAQLPEGKSWLEFLGIKDAGKLLADGLGTSEAVRDSLAEASQNLANACVDGFQDAAARVSDEALDMINEALAKVEKTIDDSLNKIDGFKGKLEGLLNVTSTGVNKISNAGGFGLLKIGAALGVVVAGLGAVLLGLYQANKYFNKPEIVKETNIPTVRQRVSELLSGVVERGEVYPKLSHVILNEATNHALQRIKLSLQGTKKRGGTFANCLFWGPPGTGKTFSAQALANEVDCYWMKFSGAALMQLSRGQAIQQIDAIFEFASRQSKPVVMIIDEADPMLEKRSDSMDIDIAAVMSHFMEKIGTRRSDIMVIASTNRPQVFDKALLRRFPDQIEIGLPGVKERSAILRINVCKMLQKQGVSTVAFTEELYQWVAEQTDGMSGSDIENFVGFLYQEYNIARETSPDAELTEEMVKTVLAEEIHKKYIADHGFIKTGEELSVQPVLKVA